jgi:hypothetical protein
MIPGRTEGTNRVLQDPSRTAPGSGGPSGRLALVHRPGTRSTARKWCHGTHNSPWIKPRVQDSVELEISTTFIDPGSQRSFVEANRQDRQAIASRRRPLRKLQRNSDGMVSEALVVPAKQRLVDRSLRRVRPVVVEDDEE